MRIGKIICFLTAIMIVASSYARKWVNVNPTFNPPGRYNMALGIFVDEKNGWFTETFPGRTWRTQNHGLTWSMQIDSSAVWSYNIEFVDCNYGWIIGKRIGDYVPFLRRTKNGGDNWEILPLPEEFVAIKFFDSLKGFAGGNDGIYYTEDGGENWQGSTIEQDVNFGVWDIYFSDRQHGWAVGDNSDYLDCGIILNTIDSGKTWQALLPITYPLRAVCFSNSKHGCAVGLSVFGAGIVLTTNDGGDNWQEVYLTCPWLNDVVFINDSTGWIVGDYGYIGYTEDGGQTWERVESGTEADLNRIVFVEEGNVGYIFGEDNTLLKYDRTGSAVNGEDIVIPFQFELQQNYPNPFNAETVIEYKIEETVDVSLRVYDLMGKEVITLVNERERLGNYKIVWNVKDQSGNEMSSGIYFYELKAGHFTQVRKMVFVR